MVEKVGFTNCVFDKLCFFFWKHYFYSVFSKTQLFKNKNYMLKKEKIYERLWFFEHGIMMVFLGFVFSGFNVIVVCFCVSGIVAKVLKMLVFFPVFWAFVGWLILVYLGLEGLGVFVVLVFGFSFVQILFLFVLVLFLFCCWRCSFIVFLSFYCFCFCFFGGFKGQVRWPKGLPQLALNPPYLFLFILFLFCLFFFFSLFLFLFFWRFKGQVRWPLNPPYLALFCPFLFLLFAFCFLCFSFLVFFFLIGACVLP